jgi:hypothetical protein
MNRANPTHPRPSNTGFYEAAWVNPKCCPLDEAAVELCEPEEELEACRTGKMERCSNNLGCLEA